MKKRTKNLRLYVVGGLFAIVTLILWARLIQVQVFGRAAYENLAEEQWKVRRQVPPIRGGIFDRNGRPLALSIRSCSVSLHPHDIKNPDQVVDALARLLDLSKRELRVKVRSDKSFLWARRQCTLSDDAREQLRKLPGVDIHWEADRIYPFDRIAAKVVGFVGHDAKGMAGIEAALDAELSGEPGWEIVQRDGRYRSKGYYTYSQKRPRNGRHVVLTIDTGLQEIAEMEIERAVREAKAKHGAMIIMHCKTGEILALAECPGPTSRDPRELVDSLWTVHSVSHTYEPGSTFKIVTAAALLEMNRVKSYDVFDAENGKADLGVAVIKDSHPHGHLTFREGFLFSSNIVMAKAAMRLDRKDFFKYVRLFGFGAETGIGLLGESPGSVASVDEWSDRTQATMAFGQEIAVTPLQMINAFAAIADDGNLKVPRLVMSIVDDDAGKIRSFDSTRIRSVVSAETARRLRMFCRAVVEEGTGTNAALPHLAVAGKTGTAEKATPRGGYSATKFVSSFIGFAPYEDPEIACLVMLDEPSYYNRFGGVSAAPAFARVNAAIANSSTIFDGMLSNQLIEDTTVEDRETHIAPNFLRYNRERAMARARDLGLNVLCKGEIGEVVAQDPDPGVAMERDEVLRLYLSGPGADGPANTPDLRGLSMRLARRKAVEAGLKCEIEGTGLVRAQRPAPGTVTRLRVVKIFCEDKTAR